MTMIQKLISETALYINEMIGCCCWSIVSCLSIACLQAKNSSTYLAWCVQSVQVGMNQWSVTCS